MSALGNEFGMGGGAESATSRKIIAADDSRMMLRIITNVIRMLDYEPLDAGDGEAALTLLEEHGGDVVAVLLDWNMPKKNGYETLCAIKGDERFQHIPVMMVTTESEQGNVVRAIQAGAKHYVMKPFSQQDLATRLMECLGMGV